MEACRQRPNGLGYLEKEAGTQVSNGRTGRQSIIAVKTRWSGR